MTVSLRFSFGTLELRKLGPEAATLPGVLWDERTACHRAPALAYADLVRGLARAKNRAIDRAHREDHPAGLGQPEDAEHDRVHLRRNLLVRKPKGQACGLCLIQPDRSRALTILLHTT